jgi:hypothetical protein
VLAVQRITPSGGLEPICDTAEGLMERIQAWYDHVSKG